MTVEMRTPQREDNPSKIFVVIAEHKKAKASAFVS